MPRHLDIDTWKRRDQYNFFKDFDDPFFGFCADVEITALHRHLQKCRGSFFFASLFLSLKAAHEVEVFRYRLRGEQVVVHERMMAGSTVLNDDETFSFCYFDYFPGFSDFEENAAQILNRHAQAGHPWKDRSSRDDMIHYSVVPWIRFTSLTHAYKRTAQNSIPKIVMGKYYSQGDRVMMPLAVEAHHALMDGLHVGRYYSQFQDYLDRAPELLI